MEAKEVFLGELKQHINSPNASVPKRRHKLLRMIGVGGGSLGLIKGLVIFGAVAALISTLIGSYLVSQTDDIALEGRLSYDLYIDGVAIGADDYIMPPDTFTDDKLVYGETETFSHTFMSPADKSLVV